MADVDDGLVGNNFAGNYTEKIAFRSYEKIVDSHFIVIRRR